MNLYFKSFILIYNNLKFINKKYLLLINFFPFLIFISFIIQKVHIFSYILIPIISICIQIFMLYLSYKLKYNSIKCFNVLLVFGMNMALSHVSF